MNPRIKDIQIAIQAEGLDGWLFFDHHQRDPLAYRILGIPLETKATRRWYYFVPAAGEPRKLMHKIEPRVLDSLDGSESRYSRWTEQREGIRTLLGSARRIAMQYSPRCAVPYVAMVDGGTLELVRDLGVEIHSSANLVQLFEARWTPAQLESHLEAGRRMDGLREAAFAFIASALRDGREVNEWQVRRFLLDGFAANGLVTDHGPIVAVNANASNPHYEPEEIRFSPIHRGDLVLIDMWAKLKDEGSVYYDITWTGFCGEQPPEEMERVFGVVREARERAVRFVQDAVEAGKSICGYQVDDAARSHIEQEGYGEYFIHRTGHSIGEDVHGSGANMDNYETHDERRIVAGTCFSVEPGVYLPAFGIRSEVNVFVDASGARVTGEAQRELLRVI